MKPLPVSLPAQDLANFLRGTVHGDRELKLVGLCSIHSPKANHLTFIKGKSPAAAWRSLIKLPEVAVLVEQPLLPDGDALRSLKCTLIIVPNAQKAFIEAVGYFFEPEKTHTGIHPNAAIDPSAEIDSDVSIGAFTTIGPNTRIESGAVIHNSVTLYRDVTIGARTVIHSGVVVREGCRVGSECIIHNNSVIGADGFGYLADAEVGILKVPQVGTVEIGDRVEIGACTSIDRATVGVTTIGSHTKIDNQVQIGHNVNIGQYCIICAQVGIAGSATLENSVVLGGGTGVADHARITSNVRVGGHSGVISDITEPGDYMGMPAVKASQYRRQQAYIKKLSRRD